MSQPAPLLSARLTAGYPSKPAVLRDARFEIGRGEILGLVGESGSGKSTIALSLLRLLRYRGGAVTGEVCFEGRDLLPLSDREMRRIRGRQIGFVPQSPVTSLNPALRIGTQLNEAWTAHANGATSQRRDRFLSLLDSVSLPGEDALLRRYPGELSVGQAQRLLVAMSILHRPSLVIADEPTSALDVVTQAEILKLLGRLNRDLNMAVLYISHDLVSVSSLCQRVAILHEGAVVECAPTEQIFRNPTHPYTRRLIDAVPKNPF